MPTKARGAFKGTFKPYSTPAEDRAKEELEQAAIQATLAEESPDGRKPWDRLESERTKPWLAFQCYRDLGPKRTLAEVSRTLYGPKENQPPEVTEGGKVPKVKSVTRLKMWMVEHNWVARAVAYDLHLDRTRQETAQNEVTAMVQRHLGISGMIQQKALNALKEMTPEQLKKSPKVLLDYLIEGAKMERLARGEVTERIQANADSEGSTEASASAREELRTRLEAIAKRKNEAKEARAEIISRRESGPRESAVPEPTTSKNAAERAVALPGEENLPSGNDPAVIALFPGRAHSA